MTTTNAVQSTLDRLIDKWQAACQLKQVKMVCITYSDEEASMIDAFLEYILALDNQIDNFVWVFESVFEDHETFAVTIAHEMQEVLQNWNTMTKPEQYNSSNMNWTPVFELKDAKNPMELLVHNLNDFASTLFPNKEIQVCYVFKNYDISKSEAFHWAQDALEISFEEHVSWTVVQPKSHLVYKKTLEYFTDVTNEIESNIDVNGVVEQLVAQADPTKPENVYRSELVKLMHAVEERKKDKVSIQAKKCLDIILSQLKTDANWISQIVTVYITLYNDQLGYKDYNEALYFADKAVEAAIVAQKTTDVSIGNRLAGQAYMGRGSIYVVKKEWEKAHLDYIQAKEAYKLANDYLMQIEACRLCGWSGFKVENEKTALSFYEEGFYLHNKLDAALLKNSTYPLLLKDVIYNTNFEKRITKQKLEAALIPIFGEDYQFEIDKYGTGKQLA